MQIHLWLTHVYVLSTMCMYVSAWKTSFVLECVTQRETFEKSPYSRETAAHSIATTTNILATTTNMFQQQQQTCICNILCELICSLCPAVCNAVMPAGKWKARNVSLKQTCALFYKLRSCRALCMLVYFHASKPVNMCVCVCVSFTLKTH